MPSGEDLLARARGHIGEPYRNVLVPKNDPRWRGPWDCAEFASWLVFQETHQLYGCTDPDGDPATTEGYTGAWRADARNRGKMIPVDEAAGIAGALLLRYPPAPGRMGHIAVSDGKGGTVEAMDTKHGVARGTVSNRHWDTGILVPGIDYAVGAAPVQVAPPPVLYALGQPNMSADVVRRIQRALADRGFDPQGLDGRFTEATAAAVARFQETMGTVVDGEVGPKTAQLLGVNFAAVARPLASAALAGAVTSNPLLAVAATVLPAIARAVAGDRGDAVAASAAQAVAEITGSTDPDAARARLAEDPALEATLQVRLAEIAYEREKDRLAAEAGTRRDVAAAESKRRDDELNDLKVRLGDVEGARTSAAELARIGGPSSWGPMLVSSIVTGGFFVVLIAFLGVMMWAKYDPTRAFDPSILQIINISVGALTVAFSTVVTFWLGSSEGSRRKDIIAAENREQQARRDERTVTTSLTQKTIERTAPTIIPAVLDTGDKPSFSNFERCLDAIFAREGGFSNHPEDNGGATNFGITHATLAAYRGHPVTEEDVRNLKREEAREIYRSNYWNRLRCDDLPLGIDLMVFDFGVHAGPAASARLLQEAVGAEQDGSIGDATLGATKAARPRATIDEFHKLKMARYRGMEDWPTFGHGWTNRAEAIRTAALDMLAPAMLGPRPIAA